MRELESDTKSLRDEAEDNNIDIDAIYEDAKKSRDESVSELPSLTISLVAYQAISPLQNRGGSEWRAYLLSFNYDEEVKSLLEDIFTLDLNSKALLSGLRWLRQRYDESFEKRPQFSKGSLSTSKNKTMIPHVRDSLEIFPPFEKRALRIKRFDVVIDESQKHSGEVANPCMLCQVPSISGPT